MEFFVVGDVDPMSIIADPDLNVVDCAKMLAGITHTRIQKRSNADFLLFVILRTSIELLSVRCFGNSSGSRDITSHNPELSSV